MRIPEEVLSVLSRCTIKENKLFLPPGQLDRKLYTAIDKVLKAAGGKWSRFDKAHVFSGDVDDAIDQILLTGEIATAQEFGFFPTPTHFAQELVARANAILPITPDTATLEPSAGTGNIAVELRKLTPHVDTVELVDRNCETLRGLGFSPRCTDFLSIAPEPKYDVVVMNPPFAKQQDIHHVRHAYRFLKPGGVLVAVMSAGVDFRSNRLTEDFRRFVWDSQGTITRNPDGLFKEAGTMVNTVTVTIRND